VRRPSPSLEGPIGLDQELAPIRSLCSLHQHGPRMGTGMRGCHGVAFATQATRTGGHGEVTAGRKDYLFQNIVIRGVSLARKVLYGDSADLPDGKDDKRCEGAGWHFSGRVLVGLLNVLPPGEKSQRVGEEGKRRERRKISSVVVRSHARCDPDLDSIKEEGAH
jgi:hypothetical protein